MFLDEGGRQERAKWESEINQAALFAKKKKNFEDGRSAFTFPTKKYV